MRLKLDSILSPDAAIIDEDLSNILDTPAVQALMEDFTRLTGMAMAIVDLQGKVLVATGCLVLIGGDARTCHEIPPTPRATAMATPSRMGR